MKILTSADFSQLAKILEEKYVNKIFLFSPVDLALSLGGRQKELLIISLYPPFPYLGYSKITEETSQIVPLKKIQLFHDFLLNSKIEKVEIVPRERIIHLSFKKTSLVDEPQIYHLYCELITNKPHLILTNEQQKIIFTTANTDLTSARPLMINQTYEFPLLNGKQFFPSIFSPLPLDEKNKLLERHYQEVNRDLVKIFKLKFQSLKRKLQILQTEYQNYQEDRFYTELGNFLLTEQDKINQEKEIIFQKRRVVLDPRRTFFENINHYFKLAQKAQKGQIHKLKEIQHCEEDLQFLNANHSNLSSISPFFWDYLQNEFIQRGWYHLPQPKKITPRREMPYYLIYNEQKIYFGKNKYQNDFLTFSLSHANDYIFHVKNYPGAHVMVNQTAFNDDTQLFAARLAITLSGLSDGEVIFGQKKYLKKGLKIGQIIFQKYQVIHLKKIPQNFEKVLEQSFR